MNGNDLFLGIVQDGKFHSLSPKTASVRLTGISMQAAVAPESQELHLTEYEGSAVMVRGHDGGGWIYSAEIVDKAGPILTAVVREVFRKE